MASGGRNMPPNQVSDATDGWTEKVINKLLKKLENEPNQTKILLKAALMKSQNTECVLISQWTKDGSMEVDKKKLYPHIMFCSLLRYPDVDISKCTEVVGNCTNAFGRNTERRCINPYHYNRGNQPDIQQPSLPLEKTVVEQNQQQLSRIAKLEAENVDLRQQLRKQNEDQEAKLSAVKENLETADKVNKEQLESKIMKVEENLITLSIQSSGHLQDTKQE